MAVDHLLGTEREEGESGLADPGAFAISAVLCVLTALVVFGGIVPRALRKGPESSAVTALVLSVASLVPGIALWWLGFPLVVAGGGVALGLAGRRGPRRALGLAAALVGALVIAAVALSYAIEAAGRLG